MPNGGSDCCAFCAHNLASQEIGPFELGSSKEVHEQWRARSACVLRRVGVPLPMSTFCANFARCGTEVVPRPLEGPVYAQGHSEPTVTYPRLPWHGEDQPWFWDVAGICSVCGREIEEGIKVTTDGWVYKFCCNSHYMRWWFEQHPDEPLHYRYDQLGDPDSEPTHNPPPAPKRMRPGCAALVVLGVLLIVMLVAAVAT